MKYRKLLFESENKYDFDLVKLLGKQFWRYACYIEEEILHLYV